jgi:hypothetical protein
LIPGKEFRGIRIQEFGRPGIQGFSVENLFIQGKKVSGHMDGCKIIAYILVAKAPVVFFHMLQGFYKL